MDIEWVTEWEDGLPRERSFTVSEISSLNEDRLLADDEPAFDEPSSFRFMTTPSSHELFRPRPKKNLAKTYVPLETKIKAVAWWKSCKRTNKFGNPKKRAFPTVQRKFPAVIHIQQLYKWEKQISEPSPGSRIDKLYLLFKITSAVYNEARSR